MNQDRTTMLAVDQSTQLCSIALTKGDQVLSEQSWKEERRKGHRLFDMISRVINEASIAPDRIDSFAVGIGPGIFSGLRISVSAFRAMALPSHKPVTGILSSRAIAAHIFDNTTAETVAVLGDARRGALWMLRTSRNDTTLDASHHVLITPDSLYSELQNVDVIATPEWERIGAILNQRAPDNARIITKDCTPIATTIARLARLNPLTEDAPAPTPVYLHPAVSRRKE